MGHFRSVVIADQLCDPSSPLLSPSKAMTELAHPQIKAPTLASLSPEERRSDLYITAIHELERRRQNWSTSRLSKIASDLGIDEQLLSLTWCLIQATNRTRRKRVPVRLGVKKVYSRLVGGIHKPDGGGIPEKELETVRECLQIAGWRGLSARRSAEALLKGREREIEIKEDTEFVDVSDSDEEDSDTIMGLSRRAVTSLPGVENVKEGKVLDVARRIAEVAKRVREGGDPGVSEEVRRMARHRYKAVEWVVRCETRGGDGGNMGKLIDGICEEADVRLHPITKRVLQDAFHVKGSLASGELNAFRALLPRSFLRVVQERELRKLVGFMKEPNVEVAEGLLKRYGSTEKCLRAHVSEIGEIVVRMLHGFDEELHDAVEERVRNVWLVARVMKDKFGSCETAREAGFLGIVEGGNESVELTQDERLAFYEGVNSGMKRKQFSVIWRLFKEFCEIGVEGCAEALGRLIREFGEEGLTMGLLESDMGMICCLIGINSDAVMRLKRVAREMLSESMGQ